MAVRVSLRTWARDFDSGYGGGAVGDLASCIETGMAGDDCGSRSMGSLDGRDDGGEGIQGSLDGGSIPAFLVGLVDQGLHPGDEIAGV